MPDRTLVVAAAAVAVALVVAALDPPAAGASSARAVTYRPPVDAPLTDRFRPPASPFGRGNRGVDYDVAPGTPVRAAAEGVVAFAGRAGPALHVVLLHADGIRTTYAFLATVAVRRGQHIPAGGVVGTSGGTLHFGARAGDAYLDPLVLLEGAPRRVRLVPDGDAGPAAEAVERGALEDLLRHLPARAARVSRDAVAWAAAPTLPGPLRRAAADEVLATGAAWLHLVAALARPPGVEALQVLAGWSPHTPCTLPGEAVPPPPGRRIAVLVGGLGSSSDGAGVRQVRTAQLGYAPGDVFQFSYRGGSTRDQPYGAIDTQGDLVLAARRLRALLAALVRQHPGVPVDVIAHSQGGVVARLALGGQGAPPVAVLVTLGTPHEGADLATAAVAVGGAPGGSALVRDVAAAAAPGVDPTAPAVRQLAEGSDLLALMRDMPLAPTLRVLSVAARFDVLVPSPRSRVDGAANTVVTVGGHHDHAALPGSAAATREIGLALAGRPPTCRTFAGVLLDAAAGELISRQEDLVAPFLAVAATVRAGAGRG